MLVHLMKITERILEQTGRIKIEEMQFEFSKENRTRCTNECLLCGRENARKTPGETEGRVICFCRPGKGIRPSAQRTSLLVPHGTIMQMAR